MSLIVATLAFNFNVMSYSDSPAAPPMAGALLGAWTPNPALLRTTSLGLPLDTLSHRHGQSSPPHPQHSIGNGFEHASV